MISKHLNNPFLADGISNANYNQISSTHIERLTVNIPDTANMIYGVPVPTIFDTMITSTQTCYNAWKASTDLNATQKSLKEGKTISVDGSMKDMKSFISTKEGVIADKFHPGTAVYEEFFPLGLSEYSSIRKKNADKILKRFITTLEAHKDSFDASMLTEANDKYNLYLSLRKTQLQTISKVKEEKITSDDSRYALAMQLYRNLLTLLLIYAEEPEKAAVYFDESILKKKSGNNKPAETAALQA